MWSREPTGETITSAHLDVLEASLPKSAPCAWTVRRGNAPMLEVVIYEDNGELREIQEIPADRLAPRATVSQDRYAAFVRAMARAFASNASRADAFMPRVLDADELVDEDDFYAALTDAEVRAARVYPTWARAIASDAGLPPPDPTTAELVGAFADCWSDTNTLSSVEAAVARRDARSGPYLLSLAEALAHERERYGGPLHTDDAGRDCDLMLLSATLPLLTLARTPASTHRIDALRALVTALHTNA